MTFTRTRIAFAAAAALTTAFSSAPAEARRHNSFPAHSAAVTCFHGDRVSTCGNAEVRSYRTAAVQRRASSRSAAALRAPRNAIEARQATPEPPNGQAAPNRTDDIKTTHNGMVSVPTVYGFNIIVHPAWASKFQRLFALLKEAGHKIPPDLVRTFRSGLGCWARGHHVSGSNHYIGGACDIQTGWNKAPAFMYRAGDLIRKAGLFDGCRFGDCGHVEAVRGTHNRPPALMAALVKFKADQSTARFQP